MDDTNSTIQLKRTQVCKIFALMNIAMHLTNMFVYSNLDIYLKTYSIFSEHEHVISTWPGLAGLSVCQVLEELNMAKLAHSWHTGSTRATGKLIEKSTANQMGLFYVTKYVNANGITRDLFNTEYLQPLLLPWMILWKDTDHYDYKQK